MRDGKRVTGTVEARQGRREGGKEEPRSARPTAGGAAAVRAAGRGGTETRWMEGGSEGGSAAPNSPAGNSRLQSEPRDKRPGFHTVYFTAPVSLGKIYPKSRVLFWV